MPFPDEIVLQFTSEDPPLHETNPQGRDTRRTKEKEREE